MKPLTQHLKIILLLAAVGACAGSVAFAQGDQDITVEPLPAAPSAIAPATAAPATAVAPQATASEMAAADFNLFEILTARGIQFTMQGKDLTPAWRVLRITANTGSEGLFGAAMLSRIYYTRGDVISVAGQSLLVAYRALSPSILTETQEAQSPVPGWPGADAGLNNPVDISPLDETTALSLSLVAMDQGTSLNDIRAFDPEKDRMTAEAKSLRITRSKRATSQSNLKQMALGLMQYAQDYDEKLPPMRAAKSAAEFSDIDSEAGRPTAASPVQVMLYPYLKNTQILVHPVTGRPYLPNYKISRLKLSEIDNPEETILFFEDAPDAENMRNVAFADGHVKALDEAEWQRIRVTQKISESGFPPTTTPQAPPPKAPKPQSTIPPTTIRPPAKPATSPLPGTHGSPAAPRSGQMSGAPKAPLPPDVPQPEESY